MAHAQPAHRVSRETRWGLVFISPGIAYFVVFWIAPVIISFGQSLIKFRNGKAVGFIGFTNYTNLLTDPLFQNAVSSSLVITSLTVVITFLLALGLALMLNDEHLRAGRLFRVIIFLPVVTDWVATGLVWQLILLPNQGVLAGMFAGLGMNDLVRVAWTTMRSTAPLTIVAFTVWKTTGLYVLLLLAGLKSVPKSLLEAARVDGAHTVQVFRFVTVPLLMPIITFVVITSFVSTIGLFEPVFMLTGGGPADATKTLPLFLYEQFFQFHNNGYASAAGILFLLLCLVFAVIASSRLGRQVN